MEPKYLNNDTLIILKSENCESGQDCISKANGNDGTFKRIYKDSKGITLQPLNNAYAPQFFTNKEIKELPVKILGIVKKIRRKIYLLK